MLKKLLYFLIVMSLWMPSVHAQDTLLVFSDGNSKPYTWEERNQIVGPIVDLITSVFNDLGIPVKTVILPWPRAIFMMQTGDIDVILTMFYTPERAEFMMYSVPYAQVYSSIFVKKGREFHYSKWEDLIGRLGLVSLDDSHGAEFDKYAKDHLKFYYVGSLAQIFKMLDLERGDYTIQPKISTLIVIAQMGYQDKIVPLNVPVSTQNTHITFSKKSPFLKYLPKVNQRIQEMQDNGTIEKMIEKVILDSAKR